MMMEMTRNQPLYAQHQMDKASTEKSTLKTMISTTRAGEDGPHAVGVRKEDRSEQACHRVPNQQTTTSTVAIPPAPLPARPRSRRRSSAYHGHKIRVKRPAPRVGEPAAVSSLIDWAGETVASQQPSRDPVRRQVHQRGQDAQKKQDPLYHARWTSLYVHSFLLRILFLPRRCAGRSPVHDCIYKL